MDTTTTRHLTTEEVATRLRIPIWSVQQKVREGLLPGFKLGKQWRFRLCDVEENDDSGEFYPEATRMRDTATPTLDDRAG